MDARTPGLARGCAVLAIMIASGTARAQGGQPPVIPNPGDVVTRFNLVGITYDGFGTLTGSITYDFTQQGWVAVEIHFPGTAASYGNPLTDPVHISPASISGSHNSDTTSYDFSVPLAQALTPTTGSAVMLDPPGTNPPDLNAFVSVDDGSSAIIYPILGGSILPAPAACYANCDNSTTSPVLNVLDFACFLNKFASGDTYANCDHSTTSPVLNVLDFACFLNRFAAGCS